jgi:hypothetical protein
VALSTNSGVAAIFGIPVCWCAGGLGRLEINEVVAPGCACTTVGATGLGGAAKAGFGTMLDLACALSLSPAPPRAALPLCPPLAEGADAALARACSACLRSGGSAW